MMRRLTIVLFMLCCVAATAQQGIYTLTVRSQSNGQQMFHLDEIDYIDFTANQMVIHPKAGSAQQYAQSDMQWAEFGADTHEAVDLGLSVKWATCNVGGQAPQDYGGL